SKLRARVAQLEVQAWPPGAVGYSISMPKASRPGPPGRGAPVSPAGGEGASGGAGGGRMQPLVASGASRDAASSARASLRSERVRAWPGPITHRRLPRRGAVVLQELAPHVPARVHAVEDGVDDARRSVDDVERRVEAALAALALGDVLDVL